MSAITTSPATCSAGGSTSGTFGAASVTVTIGLEHRADELAGVGRQPRRQVDRRRPWPPPALTSATTVSCSPVSARLSPVPTIASTMTSAAGDLRAVQLPRLRVGHLDDRQAEPADDVEVEAGVAADVGQRRRPRRRRPRRRAGAACGRRRSRRRRCCRCRTGRRCAATARSSTSDSIAATTWRPAFSISTIDGRPRSSMVWRSTARICLALSTRMAVTGERASSAEVRGRRPASVLVGLHRRADADQVAVAVGVVDAADARPELVGPDPRQRVRGRLAACRDASRCRP